MDLSSLLVPPLWFRRLWANVDKTVKRGFHVDPFTFKILILFTASVFLCTICMPLICCCARRKKNQRNVRQRASSEPIKRRFPLTVARFEEFDTLSPLIISPNSSNSARQKRAEADRIRASRELFLRQHNIRLDESPPPPRRFTGRTVIVPLASNCVRAARPVPLLGTPDSRITSFEIGTTKSCATIPEDDELELDEDDQNHTVRHFDDDEITAEGDLVSIDRTYISAQESRCFIPRHRHLIGNYANSPIPPPQFHMPPPTYTPESPKVDTVNSTPVRHRQIPSRHDTNTQGQSNLSSPEMSSCGFDSMVETNESDFMIAIDVEDNSTEKGVIDFDESSPESIQQQMKNLQLHRIEEESEQFDEASSISRFLYSSSASSISRFNAANMRIPRSISQQLEFMINNNAH